MHTIHAERSSGARERFQTDFKVYGMRDAASARLVYETLAKVEGVRQIQLDVDLRRVSVAHADQAGIVPKLCEDLRAAGFRALPRTAPL
ncbi:MAG TPA: hypothetical protein VGK74_00635 [Symbiobacteriaceae bacterium]|jgi:cation transport ATPase